MKLITQNSLLKANEGQSLLEVLIGLGIGVILIGTAAFVVAAMLKANTGIRRSQTAATLSQELLNGVHAFGEADWHNIYNLNKGATSTYFLNASGSVFVAVQGVDGIIDNDIRNGLVGYWKFNEGAGTSTADASGNGYRGTLVIGATGTQTMTSQAWASGASGKVGQALNFDGTDDYVNLGSGTSLQIDTSITVSVWVQPKALGAHQVAINRRNDAIVMYINASSQFGGYMINVSSVAYPFGNTSAVAVSLNNWYHFAMVYDYTNSKLYSYFNGQRIDSINATGKIMGPTYAWYIGERGGVIYPFNGSIDDARIYNRALSADEVYRLYNSNVFTRSFFVENVCRTTDASSTIASVAPCSGNSSDDSLTQKVTVSAQWTVGNSTNAVTLLDYLTRWKNAVFHQSSWSGGSGETSPVTDFTTRYVTSSNVGITTSGSIRILGF